MLLDKASSDDSWIDEFYRLIGQPHEPGDSVNHVQVAFDLKNRYIPKYLYRYRKPNQFSLNELERDSVYYCTPEQQNDPFDSLLSVSMPNISKEIYRRQLPDLIKNPDIGGSLSSEKIGESMQSDNPFDSLIHAYTETLSNEKRSEMEKLHQVLRDFRERQNNELMDQIITLPRKTVRICCFTTDNQSELMWAHYADAHKGVCIAYDTDTIPVDDIRRRWLYPVIYSTSRYDITQVFLATLERGASHVLWPSLASVHKGANWAYEKEWRIVRPPEVDPKGSVDYLTKPAQVYLGAQVDPDFQRQVENVAKKRGISTYKMTINPRERSMLASPL